ncbi:MAG: hypothetical protein HUJ76_12910, partial [Parasporobacterium sp.]|nr:hypothetical protein [Parasporobacterium sp.]
MSSGKVKEKLNRIKGLLAVLFIVTGLVVLAPVSTFAEEIEETTAAETQQQIIEETDSDKESVSDMQLPDNREDVPQVTEEQNPDEQTEEIQTSYEEVTQEQASEEPVTDDETDDDTTELLANNNVSSDETNISISAKNIIIDMDASGKLIVSAEDNDGNTTVTTYNNTSAITKTNL